MLRALIARLFAQPLQAGRSPRWPAARAAWLKEHPACAACGGSLNLEVHHKLPLSWGGAELDPANFLTMCERPASNCHLNVAHLGSWASYNPNVVLDAAWWLFKRQHRPK